MKLRTHASDTSLYSQNGALWTHHMMLLPENLWIPQIGLGSTEDFDIPPRTDQIDWFAKFVVIGRPDNLKKEVWLSNFSNKKKKSDCNA